MDIGNDVLFVGYGFAFGGNYQEVYRSDGTAVGTSEAAISGAGGSLTPDGLWSVGKSVLTSGVTSVGAQAIYATTDGVNFNQIAGGIGVGLSGIVVSNGIGFFGGIDGSGNSQGLWRTDGTAAGTASITPAGVTLDPTSFATVGTKTMFTSGVNPQNGPVSLWTTDGTAAGTIQLQIPSLTNPYGTTPLFSIGSKAVFLVISAPDAVDYATLWSTDGTANGTVQISTGYFPADPSSTFMSLGNKAVFSNGASLYITDGTVTGTAALASPTTTITSGQRCRRLRRRASVALSNRTGFIISVFIRRYRTF